MFSLASLTLALSAMSSVSALVVPRATPPAGWATSYLEPYDTYHTRYLAIGCNNKHNTAFFDQCCHPLLATQTAATALAAQCIPSSSASSSAPAATPTDTSDDDDDDDCDDDGDDDDETSTPVPTPTATSTKTATPAATTTASPKVTTSKTSTTKTATKTSTTKASPSAAADTTVNTGGVATFFYQNGVAGACGTVHKDTDFIAAIDQDRYGNSGVKSALCGDQVKITNTNNGKTVTVTIADDCPTCNNGNSIDLSVSAFEQLATLEEGEVPITWTFV